MSHIFRNSTSEIFSTHPYSELYFLSDGLALIIKIFSKKNSMKVLQSFSVAGCRVKTLKRLET